MVTEKSNTNRIYIRSKFKGTGAGNEEKIRLQWGDYLFRQSDVMMCGTTCLQMICKYYGKNFSQAFLFSICYATTEGISMLGIKEAAEKFGIKTMGF